MCSIRARRQSLDPLLSNGNWDSRHRDRGCHPKSSDRPLPQPKIPPHEGDSGPFVQAPVQLKWRGVYSGRRVWIILGLGLFVLSTSSSSSSSWSLSHTCTTTLGVVSVAACSSYFSPRERKDRSVTRSGAGKARGARPWGLRDSAGRALCCCAFGGKSRKQGLLLPLPGGPPPGRHFCPIKGGCFSGRHQ